MIAKKQNNKRSMGVPNRARVSSIHINSNKDAFASAAINRCSNAADIADDDDIGVAAAAAAAAAVDNEAMLLITVLDGMEYADSNINRPSNIANRRSVSVITVLKGLPPLPSGIAAICDGDGAAAIVSDNRNGALSNNRVVSC
jgi:hypothetical protein